MKPSSNAAGVDGVLKIRIAWPASETTQSVNVPPMSMQTRKSPGVGAAAI